MRPVASHRLHEGLPPSCPRALFHKENERFPEAERELVQRAKDKTLLGYHDIRLRNSPDLRLQRFIHENLPKIIPERRRQFNKFKDLLFRYANYEMTYPQLAWRVGQRKRGLPEGDEKPSNFDSD